mmetsp:Transcript_58848/g.93579  ORF Transcript_58848/g.93579 Transcript_58848/m.93579 type:complete len:386 (+) Transcript_58848:35-1192(+)|eukprot:CAMPEP_0197021578 /NCGR_PEP_ID=MMETSP1384-20130603/2495_1 /TAXON_ID=29189 /ORGANISM="Ammonia sp." /LENGTH=385 /DNA_ID=CAMNT_0042449437 /DNA_START=27 /DNA_END=1184 /DNA_ORIENTATION=+
MSTRAPIAGEQALRDAFSKADSDANFGYLNVVINLDTNTFEVAKYATKEENNDEAVFAGMLSQCKEKEHTYFIIRDPTHMNAANATANDNDTSEEAKQAEHDNDSQASKSKSSLNLYILIHYAPDLSPVKQRMMYASSRPSLKAFLGHSSFSEDYHCSNKDDLTLKKIVDARTLHHKIDFRSDAEIEKEAAALESVATSAKSQVMKSLPIKVEESAKGAIDNYKSDACKCVFLSLTAKSQSIEGEEKKVDTIGEIKGLLGDTEPKYILFWYEKSKQENSEEEEEKDQLGNKRIFGYYCPDKADRKLRFTYSTCKANVIEYCTSIGLEFYSKIELSSLNDFKEEYLDYHIFPVSDKKETFAMPKGPKTRRKSKTKARKKKINVDEL